MQPNQQNTSRPSQAGQSPALRCGEFVRPISFRGHDLDASAVVAVDPTASHSTGTMRCEWSYGFKVRLAGNEISILLAPPSQYGYSGGPSREQYKAAADKMRAEFIRLLWPNISGQTAATNTQP